jgi:DNA primase
MDYRAMLEHRGVDTYDGAGTSDFLITCPFHDDASPSLEIHKQKGMFYCFGCKEAGSFAKLLSEIESISLSEAKKILMTADNADSVLSDLSSILDTLDDEEEEIKYFSISSFHEKYKPLHECAAGIGYVRERNIPDEIISAFDLRWSGGEGKWRNRIIIPIYTESGKLLTYAGRTVKKDVKPKTRKIKGRSPRGALYGLHELFIKHKLQKFPYMLVVEGEFDAMYLQSFGLYAVSTMGTMGITGAQVHLLKRHSGVAVFSYDGDDAGRSAQEKGMARLRKYMPTLGINLPDGRDPNELTVDMVNKIYRRYL